MDTFLDFPEGKIEFAPWNGETRPEGSGKRGGYTETVSIDWTRTPLSADLQSASPLDKRGASSIFLSEKSKKSSINVHFEDV